MQKKVLIPVIAIIALVVCSIAIIMMNKPYEVITFVVDGENYSAEVVDDGALILNVRNGDESGEWEIKSVPEVLACDYFNNLDDGVEFHIIPLSEGKGDMVIHFTADDGTVEEYILTLSISRHKRTRLQIDTVVFGEYQ